MSSYLSISISDINECTRGEDNRCEQVCINTAGSYTLHVLKGMLLMMMDSPAVYLVEGCIIAAEEAFTHLVGQDSIPWTSAVNGSSSHLLEAQRWC